MYYGIVRNNHRSYTIKINFKDNYFDYIDIINNNVITILNLAITHQRNF